MARGKALHCDCGCGQLMAVDHGETLVIKARHHGFNHTLTIRLTDLIQAPELDPEGVESRIAGSTN